LSRGSALAHLRTELHNLASRYNRWAECIEKECSTAAPQLLSNFATAEK
jgi:hypothetical protein